MGHQGGQQGGLPQPSNSALPVVGWQPADPHGTKQLLRRGYGPRILNKCFPATSPLAMSLLGAGRGGLEESGTDLTAISVESPTHISSGWAKRR